MAKEGSASHDGERRLGDAPEMRTQNAARRVTNLSGLLLEVLYRRHGVDNAHPPPKCHPQWEGMAEFGWGCRNGHSSGQDVSPEGRTSGAGAIQESSAATGRKPYRSQSFVNWSVERGRFCGGVSISSGEPTATVNFDKFLKMVGLPSRFRGFGR